MLEVGPRLEAQQDRGRVELDDAAAFSGQLRAALPGVAGLPQDPAAQVGDLVGADDPAARKSPRDGIGLRLGQAQRSCARRLAALRQFVDAGSHDLERQAKAPQEVGTVSAKSKPGSGWAPWRSGLTKQ